jgi:hypothetical protein
MGLEAVCTVRVNGQAAEAKALLETSEVIVRGLVRLRIPLASITALSVQHDALVLRHPGGEVALELGEKAARTWADKIKNPKGLLDKLGVKPGMRVAVADVTDTGFLEQLKGRAPKLGACKPGAALDVVFLGVSDLRGLDKLAEVKQAIADTGAVWVVSPKGRATPVPEADVRAAAVSAGLVDVKVAAFSATHTAAKLVMPAAQRRVPGSR